MFDQTEYYDEDGELISPEAIAAFNSLPVILSNEEADALYKELWDARKKIQELELIAEICKLVDSVDLGKAGNCRIDEARVELNKLDEAGRLVMVTAALSSVAPTAAEIASTVSTLITYARGTIVPAFILGSSEARKRGQQHTYFVRNPETNQIKIGKSQDVPGRIKALRTGAGVELEFIAVIEDDVEATLHKKFSHLRQVGEWFCGECGTIEKYAKKHGRRW